VSRPQKLVHSGEDHPDIDSNHQVSNRANWKRARFWSAAQQLGWFNLTAQHPQELDRKVFEQQENVLIFGGMHM
jgi:hypothetical protein